MNTITNTFSPDSNTFLSQIHTSIEEIENGAWNGQSDAFSDKILQIFRINADYYLNNPLNSYNENFILAIRKLQKAMQHLNSSIKLQKAINKIKNISENPSGSIPGSEEDLQKLSASPGDLQNSLCTFKALKVKKFPGILEKFGQWVEFSGVPISKLGLSKEELNEIAPYITALHVDALELTNEEICEIFIGNPNLTKLVLSSEIYDGFPLEHLPSGVICERLEKESD